MSGCWGITSGYNGANRAALDVCHPSDMRDWRYKHGDAISCPNHTDVAEWTMVWLPALGGFEVEEDAPTASRVSGVRILAPPIDPFALRRKRRERINDAGKTADGGDHHRGRVARFTDASYRRHVRARPATRRPERMTE